jgi:hypothetical protein
MGNRKAPADPAELARYRDVILNLWYVRDYIQWKKRALEGLCETLPGYTAELIHEMMFNYVRDGGEIDQVVEKREGWTEYRFHYDLRPPINGCRIYIETVLCDEDTNDPWILVVNIHAA